MLTFYLFMLFKEVYKIKLNPQRTMRVLPDRQSQARGGGGERVGAPSRHGLCTHDPTRRPWLRQKRDPDLPRHPSPQKPSLQPFLRRVPLLTPGSYLAPFGFRKQPGPGAPKWRKPLAETWVDAGGDECSIWGAC